jgi:hypothetical protein
MLTLDPSSVTYHRAHSRRVMPEGRNTQRNHRRESIGRKLRAHPATAGRHRRSGAHQSMPSISIESWDELSITVPPISQVAGHWKRPCSSRLVNRQSPVPSQKTILMRLAFRPRNKKRWPGKGSCRSMPWTSMGKPVDALAHVGAAEGQVSRGCRPCCGLKRVLIGARPNTHFFGTGAEGEGEIERDGYRLFENVEGRPRFRFHQGRLWRSGCIFARQRAAIRRHRS